MRYEIVCDRKFKDAWSGQLCEIEYITKQISGVIMVAVLFKTCYGWNNIEDVIWE